MRITVLDDWANIARDCADWAPIEARAEIGFRTDALQGKALIDALQDSDALVMMRERTSLDAETIRALPRLRFIAQTGMTTRHLDMGALTEAGVAVSGCGRYYPSETAELTWALILAAERRLPQAVATLSGGAFLDGVPLGRRLEGRRLGLVGFGNIGRRVARIGAAMNMKVWAWSPSLTPARAAEAGAMAAPFEAVLEADIVSVHVPGRLETRGLIDAEALARMPRDGLLVNTSRGPVVDDAALLSELKTGRLRAALDVYDRDPLPRDHPLRHASGVTLTPHIGFHTQECMGMFYRESVENLLAWLNGSPIRVLG